MKNGTEEALMLAEGDVEDVKVFHGSAAALAFSEVEAQVATAHKYPRSIKRFLQEAMSMASYNEDVAKSCLYAMKRGGKNIAGPSVRLAEIAANAYGNLHVASRVIGEEERVVVSQGVAWDIQTNVRFQVETRRRITDSGGKRYNDDMVIMTGNAAASVSLRNAIFRVINRAFVHDIYEKARGVAVGDERTLPERRAKVLRDFERLGVSADRVLARVEKLGVIEIGLAELEVLVGLGTALVRKETTIDAAFPPPGGVPTKGAQDLEAKLRASKAAKRGADDGEPPPDVQTVGDESEKP